MYLFPVIKVKYILWFYTFYSHTLSRPEDPLRVEELEPNIFNDQTFQSSPFALVHPLVYVVYIQNILAACMWRSLLFFLFNLVFWCSAASSLVVFYDDYFEVTV